MQTQFYKYNIHYVSYINILQSEPERHCELISYTLPPPGSPPVFPPSSRQLACPDACLCRWPPPPSLEFYEIYTQTTLRIKHSLKCTTLADPGAQYVTACLMTFSHFFYGLHRRFIKSVFSGTCCIGHATSQIVQYDIFLRSYTSFLTQQFFHPFLESPLSLLALRIVSVPCGEPVDGY